MNRAEFMRRLTELLGDVSPTERDEAIQYYNDYFDDAGVENEGGVIASLGTPEELARTIKAGLGDGGNGGEFTESGFSGFTQAHKDEVIRTGETRGPADGARQPGGTGQKGGAQPGNSYYEGAYYRRQEGEGTYGGREDTRNYNNPYGQNGGGYSAGGRTAQKNGMSGGMVALIVILAVLTSPVWIGLISGLFGIAVGLLAALFGIFLALLVIGVILVALSIALLVTGFSLMLSTPLGGLCVVGSAFISFAIGLVFIWLMVLMAAAAIPAFVRGCVSLCRRLFHRGGVQA